MSKNGNGWQKHVENHERVDADVRSEMADAVQRAINAGALAPLRYMGAGAYGITFCDTDDLAFKVFRHWPKLGQAALEDEYEWFQAAASSTMNEHIPRVVRMGEAVLVRECVPGRPGGWSEAGRLHGLHGEIEKALIPLGWTAPEFKEDSYIIRPDGVAVLVDASMAQRIGERLFEYVVDIHEGRRERPHWFRKGDENFFLCREVRESALDPEKVDQFLVEVGQKPCWRPS